MIKSPWFGLSLVQVGPYDGRCYCQQRRLRLPLFLALSLALSLTHSFARSLFHLAFLCSLSLLRARSFCHSLSFALTHSLSLSLACSLSLSLSLSISISLPPSLSLFCTYAHLMTPYFDNSVCEYLCV